MKVAPLLTQFGIPLYPNVLNVCLKEIVRLSRMFPKYNLMKYTNWNGKDTQLIKIPICTTQKSFLTMNHRTGFIDDLPKNIRGGNETIREEDVVSWILERFINKYESVFLELCEKLGYPLIGRKMDIDTAQAMWDESNVNTRSQRTILRYLRATFGSACFIPTNTSIGNDDNDKKRRNIGNYESIPPIVHVIDVDGDRIHYWTKPLLTHLNYIISNRLFCSTGERKFSRDIKSIHSFDLIVGGDLGQGRFRMLGKIIARNKDKKIIDQFVTKLAHIDCKKDTYHILRDTITPSLNQDLKLLTQAGQVICLYK